MAVQPGELWKVAYPEGYPCANWQYTQNITGQQQRKEFDSGWIRQRKPWREDNASVSMSFVMNTEMFNTWTEWVTANAYDWFSMYLENFTAVQENTEVRFITPISWEYTAFDTITASVSGEKGAVLNAQDIVDQPPVTTPPPGFGPVEGPITPLPQCVPYACDAFNTEIDASGTAQYLWLLNDKETQYQGTMIDEYGSTALTAIGSASNVGEVVSVMDSCSGITSWQVRPSGAISNTSTLQMVHPEAQTLITNGFTQSYAALTPTGGRLDAPLFSAQWQYTGGHTAIVAIKLTDRSTIQVEVTSSGTISPYFRYYTLSTPVVDNVPMMVYAEFNLNQVSLWINNELEMIEIYTDGEAGAPQPLPAPLPELTSSKIDFFNNSDWHIQTLAVGGAALDTAALDLLWIAFQRNASDYVLPPECT